MSMNDDDNSIVIKLYSKTKTDIVLKKQTKERERKKDDEEDWEKYLQLPMMRFF